MSRSEQAYDILDVIRVIKGVWIFALVVPITAAGLVGFWALASSDEVSNPYRVQVVISIPTGSVASREIENEVLSAAVASGEDSAAFSTVVEDVPSEAGAAYKTFRVAIDSRSSVSGRRVLEDALQGLTATVQQYDSQIEQKLTTIAARQELLGRFLDTLAEQAPGAQTIDVTAGVANAVASLVGVSGDIEEDARRLAERGRGPLQMVTSVEGPAAVSNLRWLRFPIVAGIAGLLAVLFVAFTLDGIRLTAARRLPKA